MTWMEWRCLSRDLDRVETQISGMGESKIDLDLVEMEISGLG